LPSHHPNQPVVGVEETRLVGRSNLDLEGRCKLAGAYDSRTAAATARSDKGEAIGFDEAASHGISQIDFDLAKITARFAQ
jgi:hypothetical protein